MQIAWKIKFIYANLSIFISILSFICSKSTAKHKKDARNVRHKKLRLFFFILLCASWYCVLYIYWNIGFAFIGINPKDVKMREGESSKSREKTRVKKIVDMLFFFHFFQFTNLRYTPDIVLLISMAMSSSRGSFFSFIPVSLHLYIWKCMKKIIRSIQEEINTGEDMQIFIS